jgi:hypothetical protein
MCTCHLVTLSEFVVVVQIRSVAVSTSSNPALFTHWSEQLALLSSASSNQNDATTASHAKHAEEPRSGLNGAVLSPGPRGDLV